MRCLPVTQNGAPNHVIAFAKCVFLEIPTKLASSYSISSFPITHHAHTVLFCFYLQQNITVKAIVARVRAFFFFHVSEGFARAVAKMSGCKCPFRNYIAWPKYQFEALTDCAFLFMQYDFSTSSNPSRRSSQRFSSPKPRCLSTKSLCGRA